MLNTEGTLYKVSIEYNRLISEKIDKLNLQLVDVIRNREMFEKLILKYSSSVYKNPVLDHISKMHNSDFKHKYNKFKIEELYKNIQLANNCGHNKVVVKNIQLVTNYTDDNLKIIVNYYDSFKKCCILESTLILRIERYELLNINGVAIRYLFKNIFLYASYELFRSDKYLGLTNFIFIRITGKDRRKLRARFGTGNNKVNHGESFNTLKAIAKEDAPDIFNRFNTREIKKDQFIREMKPYVYSNDNPNGKKWIVFDNKDFDFWLTIFTKFSNVEGVQHYNIVPTNYISPEVCKDGKRDYKYVLSILKTGEDIITSKLLGFSNKLRLLERHYTEYCLNTFTHNIERLQ